MTASDARSWTLFYRDQHGRQKRLTLGRYRAVSLADARELAQHARRSVAKGGDPVVEKRAAREVLTFLSATARALLRDVPRDENATWVFAKNRMGDYKHVGRRLAQSSRANIVAARSRTGPHASAPTFEVTISVGPRQV